MLESKLQAKCVKLASGNRVLVRKVRAENRKGFPDLLLIFPITGQTVYVEMKRSNGTGQLAKLQERELKRIRQQNASAYQCDSYKWFTHIIKTHLRAEFREV